MNFFDAIPLPSGITRHVMPGGERITLPQRAKRVAKTDTVMHAKRTQAVLDVMAASGPLTQHALAIKAGIPYGAARAICAEQIRCGTIAKVSVTTIALARSQAGTALAVPTSATSRMSPDKIAALRRQVAAATAKASAVRARQRIKHDAKALKAITTTPGIRNPEIALQFGWTVGQTARITKRLRAAGKVTSHGHNGWHARVAA